MCVLGGEEAKQQRNLYSVWHEYLGIILYRSSSHPFLPTRATPSLTNRCIYTLSPPPPLTCCALSHVYNIHSIIKRFYSKTQDVQVSIVKVSTPPPPQHTQCTDGIQFTITSHWAWLALGINCFVLKNGEWRQAIWIHCIVLVGRESQQRLNVPCEELHSLWFRKGKELEGQEFLVLYFHFLRASFLWHWNWWKRDHVAISKNGHYDVLIQI